MEEDLKKISNSLKRLEQANILENNFEKATSVCQALENQLLKEKEKHSAFRKVYGKRLVALEKKVAQAKDEGSTRNDKESDESDSSSYLETSIFISKTFEFILSSSVSDILFRLFK